MQIINCKNRSQKIYSKIEAHEIVCSGFIKVGWLSMLMLMLLHPALFKKNKSQRY